MFGSFATNSVFVWGQSTLVSLLKDFKKERQVRLSLSDAKKVEENVEGIEFVVPRNQNQAFVVRNFLSGTFGINGDYPLLR